MKIKKAKFKKNLILLKKAFTIMIYKLKMKKGLIVG